MCVFPFEFGHVADARCAACYRDSPRAVFLYDDAGRQALLAFKHADRTDVAPDFAGMMAQAGSELLTGADLIILHRRQLISRRYNQSALLALALAKITSVAAVPACTKVLLRGGACVVDVLTLARVVRPASK